VIDTLKAAIAALPVQLQREAQLGWEHLFEQSDEIQRARYLDLLADPVFAHRLATLFAASPFCALLCRRFPSWLPDLAACGALDQERSAEQWRSLLLAELDGIDSVEALDIALRRFRNREYLRIVWRDFNHLTDMVGTTTDITYLAEGCIDAALDFHYRAMCVEHGTPRDANGNPQRMVVLGMGKLGAGELNLSSDIDLIFSYPAGGETDGSKSVPNQEFFSRLGQRLIRTLDQNSAEGFVFRVDMRLRPYGDSGALVLNFDAMEEYYQDQGRDWERYAMIKARPVAGDLEAGAQLMALLRPFTYRRYIDFSAFEALRHMKQLIQREVQRRKLHQNIKLGSGGIREIEFIAQCFQLIRGGRERVLQERHLLTVLDYLGELGYLPADAVAELKSAYIFLRNTEHAIQGYQDKQSQDLPTADIPRAAVAFILGFGDWPSFSEAMERHRENVSRHFANVIAVPEEERYQTRYPELSHWRSFWADGELTVEGAAEQLAEHGHEDAQDAARRLLALRESRAVSRMQAQGRERLDEFMPQLLWAVTAAARPSQTLQRILPLVEAVLRRTAYLVLCVENPAVLQQLVVLCSASPWIAAQLARHPALLDELLNTGTLYQAPPKEELRSDLVQQLLRIPLDDIEAQMEALRYFKLSHQLRVAAAEVTGRLPLMKVSDYLTWIAETVLDHVLELAWHYLVSRHGAPRLAIDSGATATAERKHFIVVGYGKFGGIELSHGSDLDLVFIHDADPNGMTDGAVPLDNSSFFTRLGQRIIHILTAQTPLGVLYDVDMRLRPSGNSGLLVSSLKAFADYQKKSAWTWEHQALVRARPVAGDAVLAAEFNILREQVLCMPRDLDKLRSDVIDMRNRMRSQLTPRGTETEDNPVFDLKHGRGGIVDLEFLVQYATLAHAALHPAVARWTDNIRILESLQAEGIFDAVESAGLTEAYKKLREAVHRRNLQQESNLVPIDEWCEPRGVVMQAWRRWLG
jgi:glutamate-ammonia-ligase adenylyltransferase